MERHHLIVIPTEATQLYSSHLTSCEMVGLRSGGTSPLFSFHEGCPAPGLGAWGLGVACSACDPAPTAAAELGKITCLNAKKKLCANGGGDRKTGPIRPER